MPYQSVFKRYEIKYILSAFTAEKLKAVMRDYMAADKYGNSTICNIYLDTPSFLLARRSLEKPIYKEKLRLRSYGVAKGDSEIFCELKKKYDDVVYKRRVAISERAAYGIASALPDTQIGRELAFCFTRYENLEPRVFLSYEREAFYATCDDAFRMTFDKNILWRDYDLSLTRGAYGREILRRGEVLLEIKTAGAIPLWLVKFLGENKIYKTSFSKYGNAYEAIVAGTAGKEEKQSA